MDKYIGEFPKLSKVNSFMVDNFIIYHKLEKNIRTYYDYKTKIKLGISCEDSGVGLSHEEFVEFLNKNLKAKIGKINS